MKLRYEQKKGTRINYGCYSVTHIDAKAENLWWSDRERRWGTMDEVTGKGGFSSHYLYCRSPRAFRRLLKQWSKYLPAGSKFVLVSRWVGHNIHGKTK